jgi:hypothetical protein
MSNRIIDGVMVSVLASSTLTFSLIIGAVTSTMKPFDDASENNPKEKSLHV